MLHIFISETTPEEKQRKLLRFEPQEWPCSLRKCLHFLKALRLREEKLSLYGFRFEEKGNIQSGLGSVSSSVATGNYLGYPFYNVRAGHTTGITMSEVGYGSWEWTSTSYPDYENRAYESEIKTIHIFPSVYNGKIFGFSRHFSISISS